MKKIWGLLDDTTYMHMMSPLQIDREGEFLPLDIHDKQKPMFHRHLGYPKIYLEIGINGSSKIKLLTMKNIQGWTNNSSPTCLWSISSKGLQTPLGIKKIIE